MSSLDLTVLGDSLQSSQGIVSPDTLKGKYIGVYFSAHWCPPCRRFTPTLRKTYNSLIQQGKNFEIIFVSSDSDLHSFQEYFDSMPWLAIPYDSPARQKLASMFNVSSIPTFVMIDPSGAVINLHARDAVESNPNGFPWVDDGSESYGCSIF
ncbi:hypothetical protein WA158_005525 [Blastocystis sp. Blastoise]